MASLTSFAATAVALTVLSGCCVIARVFARLAFVKHVGIDDCLIVFAWAASLALTVVISRNMDIEISNEESTDDLSYVSQLRQLWSSNLTYNLAVLLLKDSLLLQYLRFSIDVGYRRACWVLAAIITSYGVSAFFVGIFSCSPIRYSWDSSVFHGKCIDLLAFWLFNASFNSATDIIICVLPIPVLRALSLPRKQTVVLILLFGLGVFICAASIVRLSAVYTSTVNNASGQIIFLWSTIEVNAGIICACLPSLRHPITQLAPRFPPGWRKPRQNSARSHTSVHFVVKNPKSIFHSFENRRSSLSTERTVSRNSNVLDFSYFTSSEDNNNNDLSTTTTKVTEPATPTSLLFDLESQTPVDAISRIPSTQQTQALEKPLPSPPLAARPPLTFPTPAARPSGPRPLQSSQVFTTRSHKIRFEPRVMLPLACIPESTPGGGVHSPNNGSGSNSSSSGSLPFRRSSTSNSSCPILGGTCAGHSHSHSQDSSPSHSHERALKNMTSPSPAKHKTSNMSNSAAITSTNSSTLYGNIAPWDACPCPGSKTYTYEIIGGPRALQDAASRDMTKRERARRDRERNEWARRREQEIRDNEARNRPRGPRGMG